MARTHKGNYADFNICAVLETNAYRQNYERYITYISQGNGYSSASVWLWELITQIFK